MGPGLVTSSDPPLLPEAPLPNAISQGGTVQSARGRRAGRRGEATSPPWAELRSAPQHPLLGWTWPETETHKLAGGEQLGGREETHGGGATRWCPRTARSLTLRTAGAAPCVPGANGRLLQRLALSRHAWPCRGSHLPPGTLRADSHVPRPGNLTRGGRTGVAGRAAAMSPSGQTCTWHCGTRQSRAQSPVLGLVRPGPGAAVTSVPSEESSVVATPGDRKR